MRQTQCMEATPRALTVDEVRDLKALLLRAFEQARSSGKQNWGEMSAAVLKNRLLALTDGSFRQEDYGFGRFTDLLKAVPDLIDVDTTQTPPLARLTGRAVSGDAPIATPSNRLRSDLWDAVFDWSAGEPYVWRDGSACRVPDSQTDDLVMPTVGPEQLEEWRMKFSEDHPGDDVVSAWATSALPTSALPPHLRDSWNLLLKQQAVQVLRQWFARHGLAEPGDMLVSRVVARPFQDDAEVLRRYLQRCVAVMTTEEMASMVVPASAALRASRRH